MIEKHKKLASALFIYFLAKCDENSKDIRHPGYPDKFQLDFIINTPLVCKAKAEQMETGQLFISQIYLAKSSQDSCVLNLYTMCPSQI